MAKKTAKKKKTTAKVTKKTKSKQPVKRAAMKKASPPQADIINLILEDHKPLKALIKIMKNNDKSLSERQKAFETFGPLLLKHAGPEEVVLYVRMKKDADMRQEALEGDVEHILAVQMLDEATVTEDKDLWSARVKVLAELVEHHIKEEEEELLPDFKKNSDKEERAMMAAEYLEAQANIMDDGNERVPEKPVEDENSIISLS